MTTDSREKSSSQYCELVTLITTVILVVVCMYVCMYVCLLLLYDVYNIHYKRRPTRDVVIYSGPLEDCKAT